MDTRISGYAIDLGHLQFLQDERGSEIFDTVDDALLALLALEAWTGKFGDATLYGLVPESWPDGKE